MELKTYNVYFNKDNRNELWSRNVEATTEAQAIFFATMLPRDDTVGKSVPVPFIPQQWYAKVVDEDPTFLGDDEIEWHDYVTKPYEPTVKDDIRIFKVKHGKDGFQFVVNFRDKANEAFKLDYIEPSVSTGKSRIYFRNSPKRISKKSNKIYQASTNIRECKFVFYDDEAADWDNRWCGWLFPLQYDKKHNLFFIDIADRHDYRESKV